MYAINSNPGTMWDYSRKKEMKSQIYSSLKLFPTVNETNEKHINHDYNKKQA